MTARPPRPPREHGAWALLALPLAVGIVATEGRSGAAWLVAAAVALAFLARDPLVAYAARRRSGRQAPADWFRQRRRWGSLYLAAAIAAFAGAVATTPSSSRPALLAVAAAAAAGGVAHAVGDACGVGRVAALELVGMAGAVLAIPTMIAAAGGPLDAAALGLALAPLAYFASSLAWVRAYRALPAGRARATLACLAMHLLLAAGLLAAHAAGVVSLLGLATFVPALARTLGGLAAPPRNLRVLGLREVSVAAATALFAILDAA